MGARGRLSYTRGMASRHHETTPLATVHLASDLRSLLAVMVQCVDVVRAGAVSPSSEQALAELEGAIDSAFHISRALIGAEQRDGVEPRVVDVNELVTQARGVLERMVGPRVRLVLDLAAVAPMVGGHAVELEWVILNLVANSRDAMRDGGVVTIATVSVESQPEGPEPDARTSRRYVRLSVCDTGCGIEPETRNRVFQPFFSTKAGAPGLGLTGAAITVRRLNGWMQISGNQPQGTQVHVYLPALRGSGR